MANKEIKKIQKSMLNVPQKCTYVNVTSADTAKIDCDYSDERTVVLINVGGSPATVTFKHGNGLAGVNDVAYELEASTLYAVALDSAIFKNVSGADAGKVIITTTQTIDIAVAEAK